MMMEHLNIELLNFGSINIDHVYQVPHFVQPGETLVSAALTTVLGGKGANQSVAVARAGRKIAHIGNIGGADSWAAAELEENSVDIASIGMADSATGHAIIQVDSSGENSILLHGGANQLCTSEQLTMALKRYPSARFMLLQNETNLIAEAMQLAHAAGLAIIYNPAPMNHETHKHPLDLVTALVVNQGEGQALTGEREAGKIVDTLSSRYGCKIVIVTLGAEGALMKTNELHSVQATPVKVVDTTAAGDTFVGYFAAGMAEGLDSQANLERASQAAALAVTKMGAIPSIPNLREVDNSDGS